MDPNVWSPPTQLDLMSLANPAGNAMQVSPDGLSAAYVGVVAGSTVPVMATRASRSMPFGNPQTLADWDFSKPLVQGLWIDLAGAEMLFVAVAKAPSLGLFLTTHQGGVWTTPVNMGSQVNNDGMDSAGPTTTADGTLAVYSQNDGVFSPVVGRQLYRLHELSRSAPVTPGASFSPQGFIQLDLLTPNEDIMCPVLSPDGKLLFFGGTYPTLTNGQSGQYDHAIKIFVAQRNNLVWSNVIHLDTFDSDVRQTCPVSITADGCELYFRRFSFPAGAADSELWVAKRGP